MQCVNCATSEEIAYRLTTFVDGGVAEHNPGSGADRDDTWNSRPHDSVGGPTETVELHFCSSQCLRAWT